MGEEDAVAEWSLERKKDNKVIPGLLLATPTWTHSYKNIFSMELRYAQIWTFWLVNRSHVMSINQ